MSELIKVIQLPVIEEQLRTAKDFVDKTVADAMSLVCTEETVQTVKAARADLNRQFAELEEQRKAVKAAVLDPYNRFEAVYKECVSDAFRRADADLKRKVADVESEMKRRCEDGLREYYEELCAAHHVDFIPFERTCVTVSMADAKSKTQPPKKLREYLSNFVAGIASGVELIATMDDADEIMGEFKRTLDAADAIAVVTDRHRRIEAEKAAREERAAAMAQEAEASKKVEAQMRSMRPVISTPEEVPPPSVDEEEPVLCVRFTVTGTREKLKALKKFLIDGGYQYE